MLEYHDWIAFVDFGSSVGWMTDPPTCAGHGQGRQDGRSNVLEPTRTVGIIKQLKETSNTGDQGVDLIASINDLRICIQCKDHEKAIGNKAVQEISAGKLFWKGTHAIIVSKSGFTKSAHQLAKSNKVELINEYQLKDLEKFIF